MSIVYILTNECMPDVIKIGMTDDLERRLKDLDTTGVPLPFECYYAVEVGDRAEDIEKSMHEGLDDYRVRQSRIRQKRREFFYMEPEQAKSLLKISGGKDVTPIDGGAIEPEDKQAIENAKDRRERFNFKMVGIEVGETLHFKKDHTITCEVVDDKQVKFRGEVMSLSASAAIVIKDMGYDWLAVSGTLWWCYKGKTLHDLRSSRE